MKIRLQGQPVDILVMLLQRPGEAVTREELQEKLWPADTFVDFEQGLNNAMKRLRAALDDDAESPHFIETIPRRGYRFIGAVNGADHGASWSDPDAQRPERDTASGKVEAVAGPARARKFSWQWAVAIVVVIAVLAATFAWPSSSPLPPRVLATTQLTRDGRPKFVGATDGSRLYISDLGGRWRIVQVSIAGGETSPIPTPFAFALADGISPDHTQLLVESVVSSDASANTLWSLPLPSGSARRLGDTVGHDGAWSPDGRHLVFCKDSDIYRANADGTDPRKLVTVQGTPLGTLTISPDGTRIRFTIAGSENLAASIWEVRSDGSNLHPVLPGWHNPASDWSGAWTPDGRYYFFLSWIPPGSKTPTGSNVWVMREPSGLFHRHSSAPFQLTTGPLEFHSLVPSADGKKLFVGAQQRRGELVRYDPKSGQFVPFLAGISASDLDFSRDGKWVTYVAIPEDTLWRSRVDGSDRLQLTYPPVDAGSPRWSPDATQIAFVDHRMGRPSQAFLISAQGGAPREILAENATDTTWSPDGKKIAFARWAAAPEAQTICIIDLATHQVSTVPGSKGLSSPDWSPDGRYLAALNGDSSKLLLSDFKTQKWSDWIAEPGVVGNLNWSQDGSYLYYDSTLTDHATFRRAKVGQTHSELLVDLRGLDRYSGPGFGLGWSGIAPDGSALFIRDLSMSEIYALDLDLP